ncbi:hypothetical protein DNK10_13340 [Pseudomonas daroniae]|nr:hypothetical protein DNK10_13340 [Pseudomonas daroniae]
MLAAGIRCSAESCLYMRQRALALRVARHYAVIGAEREDMTKAPLGCMHGQLIGYGWRWLMSARLYGTKPDSGWGRSSALLSVREGRAGDEGGGMGAAVTATLSQGR